MKTKRYVPYVPREEALLELSKPLYDEDKMRNTIHFIKEKLGLSNSEFDQIMSAPTHQHTDFRIEDETMLYRSLRILKKYDDKRQNSAEL